MNKIWPVVTYAGMGAIFTGCSLLTRAREAICGKEQPLPPDPQMELLVRCWWLVPGAILGVAAAVFLAVHGKLKLALALAAACGVGLWLSVSVFSHFNLIGYFGLAIPIAILGYAIYKAKKDHKELEVDRRAIPELIETAELTKDRMPTVEKIEVFGDTDDSGLAGTIQSPETEKLVAEVRKNLK